MGMVLSDRDIKKWIRDGKLKIEPFDKEMVQPSSVDLHLGNEFLMYDSHSQTIIDVRKDVSSLMKKVVMEENKPLILHPREFVLATSTEKICLPDNLVGRLEGKSSLGRMGLIVHSTAGYFDPGFCGQATLEIYNLANLAITLYPGMKICQFSFAVMTSPVEYPYGHTRNKSHYQGQKGVVGANTASIWGRK